MKILSTLLFIIYFTFNLQAQNLEQKARQLIDTKNQVTVQFTEKDKSKLKEISKRISIDDYQNGLVTAVLSKLQIDAFLALGYTFTIPEHRSVNVLNVATTIADMADWDQYPSYDLYIEMMQSYANDFPNICRLDTIGFSQNGRLVLALKITDQPEIDENEPEFLYSGQMHGDELVSSLMFLRFIDFLLNNYDSDAEVTSLVNNIEIWINPLANPDGCYYGGNNNVSNSSRYVANGVDLNRNFPNPIEGEHPDNEAWALETVDMMNFCTSRDFVMSANSHSGAEVVNYPWDTWESSEKITADDDWWQYVSQQYADSAQAYSPPNYLTDVDASGFTNGADWYFAFGSRQDYMNYYQNCREVTLELSSNKRLDSDELPFHWNYNKVAMTNYLKQVQYGINGIVTDECTSLPIKAKIEIQDHDIDQSHVYSAMPLGDFHRPIFEGTYTVIISADGYQSQTFENISVENYATTGLNASLEPLIPETEFAFALTSPCSGEYTLTNLTAGNSNYLWTFPNGETSSNFNENITFTENNNYTIQLKATNACSGSDSISHTINVTEILTPPNTSDIERCGPGEITFSASPVNNGTISWYDAEDGSLWSSETDYTTNITENTTLWVTETETPNSFYGGKEDQTGLGGNYSNNTEHALIFDCTEAVALKSVKVYANGAGNRTFKLIDGLGNTLYEQAFSIANGESRIDLDWDIPIGEDFYLYGPASPNLYRNGGGSSDLLYPFEIEDKISIKWNTADDAKYYYYFYDWEIETKSCSSPAIPVTASVKPLPIAHFSFQQNEANVSFSNTSSFGDSYSWDFGDEITSNADQPIHIYTNNGTFMINLTTSNACGTDLYLDSVKITTIDINELEAAGFSIYPNPAKEKIYIETQSTLADNLTVAILNSTGAVLFEKEYTGHNIEIDMSSLTKGSYLIQMISAKKSYFHKLIKL